MYKAKLEHSFDEIQSKASTFRSELTGSFGIDAARVVELDLSYDDDDSEDEGEVMLLAMILLQLHGVKFPGGFPDQHNKKKRQRTSPDQLAILEQIFQTDKMPSQQTRVHLADQLGMSSRRVQIWFQNKRAKVKRGLSKSTEGNQQAPMSPDVDMDSRDGCALSSSSGISEPPSPIVPDSSSSPSSPPPVHSLLSPSSPNSPAVVPSSPYLSHTFKHSQASQLPFSLSLASQSILLPSEFTSLSAC